jgi:phospholipid/cholesterol/gamma-HCH transport system substrate-binding protein
MEPRPGEQRIPTAAWTLILFATIIAILAAAVISFTGTFRSFVPVTLTSDRAGLVMESGGKVKFRGVQVGRVGTIEGGGQSARLQLELFPDQVQYIPSNVQARIRATTAFGAKYVDLTAPGDPSAKPISAGAVLLSQNVSTEVNTVFQNIVNVLDKIDPAKLNAILSALAEGVRGQGERIGQATTDANEVLKAINPRMDTMAEDWRSFKGFNDAYAAAAPDILKVLDAASTTSETITTQSADLDALLMGAIGFGQAGVNLLGPNKDNRINAINVLQPTTELLHKYSPALACTFMGAQWWLDNGGNQALGGNGRTLVVDAQLLLGDDTYRYPENLPVVAAKGGPGGKPSCGSLPDATKNYPIRQIVTNTGFGAGLDWRPNPGIGFPGLVNYFPTTKAIPEPPRIRYDAGPAIGPIPYPGAPPYGAPLYGPDGPPLYPPPPGAPPPPPPPAAPLPPGLAQPEPVAAPAAPPVP